MVLFRTGRLLSLGVKIRENLMRNINKQNFPNITLDSLKDIFINILDTFAPVKHKYVRANQAPFMTKTLNKH